MDLSDIVVTLSHLIVFVVFANRYFVGMWVRRLMAKNLAEVDDSYEPTVSIVVPMFNEGEGIYRTIRSLATLDYPHEKLKVIVVDDCSTDDSYRWASKGAGEFDNVEVMQNPVNMGKRKGINRAVRRATSELIVSVDSDVIVDKDVIRKLVRRFTRDEIAAVGGRVNILNKDQNWLTRMQAVKNFFGYEYLKNLENAFNTVMCLSGCLTAYRRHVLLELEPILENRNVCGIPIKYGEDRFLTRQIVKAGYQTRMTLEANAYTIAPPTLDHYFSQQLRWRRSNLVDYFGGLTHIWKVHPAVTVHYLGLFAMMVTYPLIIMHHFMSGNFFELAVIHVAVLGLFCGAYGLHALKLPEKKRTTPFEFLAMAFVMPVTYLLLTPLAAFTLDTGSWETRGHGTPKPDEAPTPAPVPVPAATVAEPLPAPAVSAPIVPVPQVAHANVVSMAPARAARAAITSDMLPSVAERPASYRRVAAADR